MAIKFVILLCGLAAVTAAPAEDPVIAKWASEDLRYAYLEDDQGQAHLVDKWMKLSDLEQMARYNPDVTNQYHLFSWQNQVTSQPLVINDMQRLQSSNFNPNRRTVMLMHGFAGSATSNINSALVHAYLRAGDFNIVVLDWSSGSFWGPNAIRAGQAAARFINWVNSVTGSRADLYTIVGYSVGGHGAGHIARNVNGNVAYVIGLDPADRWDAQQLFLPTDGVYTECIHTSTMGVQQPLAQVDFFPNGGSDMPGCITSLCDHERSFNYLAESLISGGFTGRRCANLAEAKAQNCSEPGVLNMGGTTPKMGNSGIFHLRTNFRAPFSQG